MQLSLLSSSISLNLVTTQARLRSEVSQLSSGLRIQTAADDPSGLAIAENLHAQVRGYDQAAQNVQTASNAITVADGALQNVTDLLDRLIVLSVKARNDLLSVTDRNNIQAESQQLQNEINTIADSVNFNGVQLLNRQPFVRDLGPQVGDGTFESPAVPGYANMPAGSPWNFAGNNAFGGQGVIQTSVAQAADNVQLPPSGSAQLAVSNGNGGGFSQTVSNFKANSTYALTFNLAQGTGGAPPENIVVSIDGVGVGTYSPTSVNPLNPDWKSITTSTFAVTAGAHVIGFRSYVAGGRNIYIDDVQIQTVSGPSLAPPQLGSAVLAVHDGPAEGDFLNVALPTVFTSNLGISADTVDSSATAATYETNLNLALDAVSGARATLGALQIHAANDNTAAANLTASESNIRDENIANVATAFAEDQIRNSISTAVLANAASHASLIENLFA